MRLNILRRGEGLGGRGRESGFGSGRGGAFMICLLWGTTALGMKIDTRQQLDRREPEPQRARVTEWVTVTLQGGWRVTEYSTTTITPTAASAAAAIVTVTSIMTTGTTVTNTVTDTVTITSTTESTAPITTATTSTLPITTTSTSTSTSQAIESTAVNTTSSSTNTNNTTSSSTNTNTNTASTPTSTPSAVITSSFPTSTVTTTTQTDSTSTVLTSTSTSAGTPVSKSEAVAIASVETPQPKNDNVVVVTDIVTGTPLTTSTVTKVAATSTNWAGTWGQGGPVRRRQAAQETITLTETSWNWQDGVTTSILTEYATPTGLVTDQASMAIPTTVTTTMISTQVSTYTTQQTVTATATPSTSAATASPSALIVDNTPTIGGASPKTPNVEVIVGACFGALVGFIGIFVLAYLWAKKRRDENLRKESAGFSNGSFLRSSPGAGSGVRGMIGSLRRGPSARYNNIPNGESAPNMSPLPAPPHSPPPQLPQLRVMPPSGEFNYEYTFGSPVSSIGEAQLHALTSGAISPPAVGENHQDEMFFDLPRQESEQPPWSSSVMETMVAETVVSSVSAQSDGPIPSSSVSISVSGTQSPTRKPVPVAAGYVVSP